VKSVLSLVLPGRVLAEYHSISLVGRPQLQN
jgi:hypothetical protein